MTVLVDQALQMFIERRSSDDNQIDSEAHGGEQDE
jgi:HPt (histidine-containing phosphotransfer) domain-containing protein